MVAQRDSPSPDREAGGAVVAHTDRLPITRARATPSCVRRGFVERTRNITLSLPEDLLKRAKWLAVEGDTSVSRLLAAYLERIVEERDNYAAARRRAVARLHRGFPVGDRANSYAWSRDELHDRN